MARKITVRKLFNDVHLWLGIASGIILFLVCLSGTILAFEHEIESIGEGDISSVSPQGAAPLSSDSLVTLVGKELKGKVTAFRILEDKSQAYQFYVKGKGPGRPAMYYVNQYTGAVQGKAGGGPMAGLMESTMQLHRFLLLDPKVGRPIVGVATIIFVLLVLTGLVLWVPRRLKLLKQSLTIRRNAGWKRINHDLHNTLGFYAFPLLLILGLTGLNWSFEWYRNGMSKLIGDQVFKQRSEKPLASDSTRVPERAVSLEEFIETGDRHFAYSGDRYIMLPAGPNDAVQVRKKKAGFFALAAADRVHIDRFSGEAIRVEHFHLLPFNEQVNALMRPLHTGEVMGTFSKILYFLACLIATSLPVTGTLIWINKLKKKRRRKGRAAFALAAKAEAQSL